jgi:hypothetical protein
VKQTIRIGDQEGPLMLPDRQSGPDGRLLEYTFMTSGALCLALAMIGCGPPVSLNELSLGGVVEALRIWRWVLLLAGWVLLPTGVLLSGIRGAASDDDRRALARNAVVFLAIVAGLALAVYALMAAGRYYGTAYYFPISVFRGPETYAAGIPFAVAFLIVLGFALRRCERLGALQVWGIALGLIVLGNLAQGGVGRAFEMPVAGSGVQYYHEAIKIGDWREWLRGFQAVQASLGIHARTHPPFAVLLHSALLKLGGGNVLFLAGALTVLSSLAVPLVRSVMRELGSSGERAGGLALLFAVIPAVNIYSAVSLDGVVAMLAACLLLGLVKILRRGLSLPALALLASGLILANALTFAGLLLLAVAGLVAVADAVAVRRASVAVGLLITLAVAIALLGWLRVHLGYDHIRAFFEAVRLERAQGGSPLRMPGVYVWTRAEDVLEIALFASVGVVAVLFRPRLLGPTALDVRDRIGRVFLAMGVILAASFLMGTHRTGETARACLFGYPFLMLALGGLDGRMVRALALSAGVQTAAMQLFGAYFW